MKSIFILFIFIASALTNIQAQNITAIEYFFDTDPGYGNGTAISFTPSAKVTDLPVEIPVIGLTEGYHTLYVRAKDNNGRWSVTHHTSIYKIEANTTTGNTTPADVVAMEYVFDTDPGYGAGNALTITPGQSLEGLAFDLAVTELTEGYHTLYVRAKDNNGRWSVTHHTSIYKIETSSPSENLPPPAIERIEYFIDTDPGYGNAISLNFTPGQKVENLIFDLDVSALSEEEHILYVRAKDANGRWSVVHYDEFNVCNGEVPEITSLSNVSATAFTINWNLINTASKYLVDVSADTFKTFINGYQAKEVFINTEQLSGLTEGTKYQVRVRAYSNCNSIYSTVKEVSLPLSEPASQPSNLVIQNPTENSVQVSFNNGSGATGYLAIRKQFISPTFIPTNNTQYVKGQQVGDGVVAFVGSGLGFIDAALEANSEYFYDIFSYKQNQEGTLITYLASNPLEGNGYTVGSEPLGQPTNLNFTNISSEKLSLSFDATDANAYMVTRRQNNESTFIPSDGVNYEAGNTYGDATVIYLGDATSIQDSLLSQLTLYYYTVFAFNGDGERANFQQLNPLKESVTTALQAPQNQPTNLRFSNISFNGLTIEYEAAIGSFSGYLIIRSETEQQVTSPVYNTAYAVGDTLTDGSKVVYIGTGTSFNEDQLRAETKYFYKIYAYIEDLGYISYNLDEPLAGEVTTYSAEPANQVSQLAVSNITETMLNLTLTLNNPDSESVLVLRSDNGGGQDLPLDGISYAIGDTVGTSRVIYSGAYMSISDSLLISGNQYTYSAYAFKGQGLSSNYNTDLSSQNRINVSTLPEPPNNFSTEGITNQSFKISFKEVNGASSYRTDVSTDNFETFISGYEDRYTVTPYIEVTGLTSGVLYQIRIRAENSSGVSQNSDAINQITIPQSPNSLAISNISQSGFLLKWNTSIGVNQYRLDISEDNFSSYVPAYQNKSITADSTLVDGLVAGNTYQIRLRAENEAGQSENSEISEQLLIPATPVGIDATNTTSSSFKAKWTNSNGATEYFLDVSLAQNNFNPSLTDFDNVPIGNALEFLVTNLDPNIAYSYRVRASNEVGLSSNSNTISVNTLSQGSGVSLQLSALDYSNTFSGNQNTVTLDIISGFQPLSVNFYYRPIRSANFILQENIGSFSADKYEVLLTTEMLDEIGVEFYFEVFDGNGLKEESESGFVYKAAGTSNTILPFTKSGGTLESYEFFSIPYEIDNNLIAEVFEEMGAYNPGQWRLVRYQNGRMVDFGAGLNRIELGKAYWFNQKSKTTVGFTDARTANVHQQKPFIMQLEPGWNQIGNPFTYEISWEEVLAFNDNPSSIGSLKTYDDENIRFVDDSRLLPWSGGFVYNDNSSTMNLLIPVIFDASSNRQAVKSRSFEIISNKNQWLLPLEINESGLIHQVNAIGMHPEATDLKDWYDDVLLPKWGSSPVLYSQTDNVGLKLTKDIVKPKKVHKWKFNMHAKLGARLIWDSKIVEELPYKLWLFDETNDVLINMSAINSYIPQTVDASFIISYTNDNVPIEKNLIGTPYPNPFKDIVNFPFVLVEAAENVKIEIYNNTGQKIKEFISKNVLAGEHTISIDFNNILQLSDTELLLIVYKINNETYYKRIILKE